MDANNPRPESTFFDTLSDNLYRCLREALAISHGSDSEIMAGLDIFMSQTEQLSAGQKDKMLQAANRVVSGTMEAWIGESALPSVIDRLDFRQRGTLTEYGRYGRIMSALGFQLSSSVVRNDSGMRLTERRYESPYFLAPKSRLVIDELWQGHRDLTLYAAMQPSVDEK